MIYSNTHKLGFVVSFCGTKAMVETCMEFVQNCVGASDIGVAIVVHLAHIKGFLLHDVGQKVRHDLVGIPVVVE